MDEADLKSYLISWLSGANNSPIWKNSFYETLGYETLVAIKNDEFLSQMYKELNQGRKLIVKENRNSNGLIRNILGIEQPRKHENKKNDIGSELYHILLGYEVKTMEIVEQFIGEDMQVLVYDG